MSAHIDARRKLRQVELVHDFEHLLSLCTLSDEDKEIMRMHYIRQKDFRYIGDTLGFSEAAVKARHKEALRKLSKAL